MAIQVLTPKYRIDECLQEIRECLEKSWTGMGFKTQVIEEQWCTYTGLPQAHFLNSNTVGLHLALYMFKAAYGWQDGDEVITTPLTFVSTNHAILYEDLEPVFADIDDTLCLDPASIVANITPKTRAVLYVGIGGNSGRLKEVARICQEHNLKLILDAAHMAGTRLDGKHVGQQADVTVFSFQAVKNLPTADSGMICFQDAALDAEARKMTWLGINKDTYARTGKEGTYKWKYEVEKPGFKYHGNSIMAALAITGLKYLDADNAVRRKFAAAYKEALKDIAEISFIETIDGCESAQHLFQIRVRDRDALIEHLQQHDIFPGVHYRDNTEYTPYSNASNRCPGARLASQELISLPLHLHLTDEDITLVANTIKKFYDR